MGVGTLGGQKRALDLSELESEAIVSRLTCGCWHRMSSPHSLPSQSSGFCPDFGITGLCHHTYPASNNLFYPNTVSVLRPDLVQHVI